MLSLYLVAPNLLSPLGIELAVKGLCNIESRTVNGCRITNKSAASMSVKTNLGQKHQNAGWSSDIPAGSVRLASEFLKSISPYACERFLSDEQK